MSPVLRGLLPGAAVAAAAAAALLGLDPQIVSDLTGTYRLVVYGAGLALSCVFHRSRAFIALVVIAWLDVAAVGRPEQIALLPALGTTVLGIVGLLALTRDRGVASRVGAAQALTFIGLVAVAGYVFVDPVRLEAVAGPEARSLGGAAWSEGYAIATLGAGAFALLATLWGVVRYRGPVEHSLLWSVLFLFAALYPGLPSDGSALLVVAAGLVIVLSIVETSYAMAYRDELTGLPGRRALMQALDGIQGTYTLAMVDVDHFKKFNDKHGHDVGDQVLKLVASRLAQAPGGAKAYRYGGEEFTLVLAGRVREDALEHLEAVRAAIEHARFSIRSWRRPRKKPEPSEKKPKRKRAPKKLSVTVSIGMADTEGAVDGPEAVLKKADQALYRAKKKGRNQVSK